MPLSICPEEVWAPLILKLEVSVSILVGELDKDLFRRFSVVWKK